MTPMAEVHATLTAPGPMFEMKRDLRDELLGSVG